MAALTGVADRYGADRIVLARRDGGLGLVSRVATLAAAETGGTSGSTRTLHGNGWDAVVLEPGARLTLPLALTGQPIALEVRVLPEIAVDVAGDTGQGDAALADPNAVAPDGPNAGALGPGGSPAARRVRILAGDRVVDEIAVPFTGSSDFTVIRSQVTPGPGEPLVIEGVDRIAIQSVTGYVPDDGPPPGWLILTETDDAVVWARAR